MNSIIRAETLKNIVLIRKYFINEIGSVLEDCIFFGGILFVILSGETTQETIVLRLLGIVLWQIAGTGGLPSALRTEARNGTLEQIYLTGQQPQYVFWINRIIRSVFEFFRGLILVLPAATIIGGSQLLSMLGNVNWTLVILSMVLASVGMFGLELLLASFSFVTRQVQVLGSILQYYFLFFATLRAGEATHAFGRLFPITFAADSISVAVKTPGAIPKEILLSLLLTTLLFILAGSLVFAHAERVVRSKGGLTKF